MPFRTGEIIWESHGHRRQSLGRVDGEEVGRITRRKNHTDDGIYGVSIMGIELAERFRTIDEARAKGWKAYLRLEGIT